MGFLDKVQDSLNQGQQKLDAVQNKRALEAQLVNLGKWVYATRTGQDGGRGEAEIDIALHQITAMVGQYGMFDLPFATPGAGPGQAQPAPAGGQSQAPGAFPPPGAPAPSYEAPAYGAPPSAGGAPPAFDPPPAHSGAPPTGGAPPGSGVPPSAGPPSGPPPSAGGAPPVSVDPSAPGGLVPGAPPQVPHDPARADGDDDPHLPGGPPPGFGSPPPS